MKKLNLGKSLGIALSLSFFVMVFSVICNGCSKSDPPPSQPPVVLPKPTISVTTPSKPWYDSSVSIIYSCANTDSLKINGVKQISTSGSFKIQNVKTTVISVLFEAYGSGGYANTSINVSSYDIETTILCNTGMWKMVKRTWLINGVLYNATPLCLPCIFYPEFGLNGFKNVKYVLSTCSSDMDFIGDWYFTNNNSKIWFAQSVQIPPRNILELIKTSFITSYQNTQGDTITDYYSH